ncbi:MAG: ABC transporter transmembrane domain-containing protein [Candidatus Paceibacterota bacterium]
MKTYLRTLNFLKTQKIRTITIIGLAFALSILSLLEPFFFKEIIDSLTIDKGDSISKLFLIWGVIVLANILIQTSSAYLSSFTAHRIYCDLWKKSLDKILNLSVNFFQGSKVGSIMRNFERGIDNIYYVHLEFFRHILASLFIIIILVPILIFLNFKMALLILLTVPLLALFVSFGVKKAIKTQKIADEKWSSLSGLAYDSASNISLIQSFTLNNSILKKVDNLVKTAFSKQIANVKWWSFVMGVSKSAGLILNILVFLMGSHLFMQNEISLGSIIMFVGFSSILINIFNSLFWNIFNYSWRREKINLFLEVFDKKPKIKSKKGSIKPKTIKGEIEFKNVSFSYKDEIDAIRNISFNIKQGEVVAFVGHTGSGKTTTANLISRFYEVQKGQILIDNIDIKDIDLNFLRKNIGVVFQDNTFLNTSFLENLKIKKSITKKQIETACKKAHIWDLISKNKKGLNEIIGDKGTKLSGGEKQRLSIARAILKDAPILILDEATSALDAKTESKIQKAISNVTKGRTTIIIAHRLSTIKKADRIFVFEDGKIIEQGNFKSLISKKQKFYDLAKHQVLLFN